MSENTNTEREALMKLADAYADASFDQGLYHRTLDDKPEEAREELEKALSKALEARSSLSLPAAGQEPVAYLHDDGYWTPAKTEEGRKLNDRLHFAGSEKIGVHLAAPQPAVAAGAVDALTVEDAKLLEKAVTDFDEFGDTDVPDADLRRFAAMGLLECAHYNVLPAAQEAIDAALAAQRGGAA